ncbi:MAG: molybdopterin molybdotransferase MoeA [Clostridiales bacterium]|nr:molybdopterin molybdotransferase MoeA [Clostridiales bacterium]
MKQKMILNPIEKVLSDIHDFFGKSYDQIEMVELTQAQGRYLASDIISKEMIPDFSKSTVDGYAVKFSNGPCTLKKVGESFMGSGNMSVLNKGECIYVPTGGMIPEGTETMVMIEDTEVLSEDSVYFKEAFIDRENIIERGSDMSIGQVVLTKGTRIGTHEIGALAALGYFQVEVMKSPGVTFISTGDELTESSEPLKTGQIREINTFTLASIAQKQGLRVINRMIVKDDYDEIKATIEDAISKSDLVFISGGSSVGEKDYTYELLDEICDQGVLINGMAIKPGKPTIVSKHGDKPVIGLPGHPVSSIIVYELLASEILRSWGFDVPRHKSVEVTLSRSIRPAKGRDTYQMVQIKEADNQFVAVPTSGKSGMISLLTGSNGYVIISKELDQLPDGSKVRAYYFNS